MAEPEARDVTSSTAASTSASGRNDAGTGAPAFERAKRHLLLACAFIGGGLAVAGTVDRTTGGVLVLIGWLSAIASLHRLGRTGSDRGPDANTSS